MTPKFLCFVCGERFNLSARRPKLLPCGHTYCSTCVVIQAGKFGKITCPEDMQVFAPKTLNLVDNRFILARLEDPCIEGILVEREGYDSCKSQHQALEVLQKRLQWELAFLPILRQQVMAALETATKMSGERLEQSRQVLERLRGPRDGRASGVATKRDKRLAKRLVEEEDDTALLKESQVLSSTKMNVCLSYGYSASRKVGRWQAYHLPLQECPEARLATFLLEEKKELYFRQRKRQEDLPQKERRDLTILSIYPPQEKVDEKKALLQNDPVVRELVGLNCHLDPDWSLAMLRSFGQQLLRVQMQHPSVEHLLTVWDMRRLQELHVMFPGRNVLAGPVFQPSGLAKSRQVRKLTLQWMPVESMRPLLREWGDSLLELQLKTNLRSQYDHDTNVTVQDVWLEVMPQMFAESKLKYLEVFRCNYGGNEREREIALYKVLPAGCRIDWTYD